MASNIDIIIPGLCGPLPDTSSLQSNTPLTSLIKVLCRATRSPAQSVSYATQLCESMGLSLDKIPYAEIALTGYGIDRDGYHWMHADPVYMRIDPDKTELYDSNSLSLNDKEALGLIECLNHHFDSDNITFVMADANHWFVRSNKPFDVDTFPLAEALTQNVNALLPSGPGEIACKQLLTESQMLLFANDINQHRESRGLLPVNSIWLWGEGCWDEKQDSNVLNMSGDDVFSSGLSQLLNIKYSDSKTSMLQSVALPDDASQVLIFSDLMQPSLYGDATAWVESLNKLYKKHLSLLLNQFADKRQTVSLYPCNGYRYVLKPFDKFRIWKRASMELYFETGDR